VIPTVTFKSRWICSAALSISRISETEGCQELPGSKKTGRAPSNRQEHVGASGAPFSRLPAAWQGHGRDSGFRLIARLYRSPRLPRSLFDLGQRLTPAGSAVPDSLQCDAFASIYSYNMHTHGDVAMSNLLPTDQHEESAVLGQATLEATKWLGVPQNALQTIVGKHPSNIRRYGLDPATKPGELALLLIRLYRSLYVLVGGDAEQMRHWMHTPNRDTGGVPAEQIRTVTGLAEVVAYLDAMRGMP